MAVLGSHQRIDRVLAGKPFGDGNLGDVTTTSITVTRDTCTGTASTTTLSTGASTFANGDVLFIWQTRNGANVTKWEINKVASGGGTGTLTMSDNLQNTYSSGAQAVKIMMYNNLTANTGTMSITDWNGSKGGIMVVACKSTFTLTGTIECNGANGTTGTCEVSIGGVSGGGFYGGGVDQIHGAGTGCDGGSEQLNNDAQCGEGTAGTRANQGEANGNGGGGGEWDATGSGAGGGNGTAGSNGNNGAAGGAAVGANDLTTMSLGGGGGGAMIGYSNAVGSAGSGAGALVVFAKTFAGSGTISLTGGQGGNGDGTGDGGSGAGGSLLLAGQDVDVSNWTVSANGGAAVGSGGAGGNGRVAVHYSKTYDITGLSTPTPVATLNSDLLESGGGFFAFL